MYAVKPVLARFEDIELSKSMYRMKSQGISCSPGGHDFLDKLTKQVELIVSKVIPVVNVLPVACMLLSLGFSECGVMSGNVNYILTPPIPFQDGQSSMSLLAARQDIILEKLHDLKEQLVTMKNSSRVCFKPPQNVAKSSGGKGNKAEGRPEGRCQAKVSSFERIILEAINS